MEKTLLKIGFYPPSKLHKYTRDILPPHTKTDEFSEKFQAGYDPLPLFSENDIVDFF